MVKFRFSCFKAGTVNHSVVQRNLQGVIHFVYITKEK